MCHHCTNTNDQMKPEGCNPTKASGGEHIRSQKPLEVNTQQGNQDVSSPSEPRGGTSPTASLTSSDSFASSSDSSVDLNLDGRDNQVDSRSKDGKDDFRDRQNGHPKKSSPINAPEKSILNVSSSNSHRVGKDGSPEIKDYLVHISGGLPYTFDDPTDADIWIPPPAENEDSLATFVDDDEDDEVSPDGIKWGEPTFLDNSEDHNSKRFGFKEEKEKAMEEVMNGKFRTLVSQLLKTLGIVDLENEGERWVDIVSSLAWAAALFVKPEAAEGKAMDPAGYVKVKCVATGSRSESKLIKGLVFKKHAAHKHMPTKHMKPRLLLIKGMLGHSGGLSSFNSMIQDKDKDNMSEEVKYLLEPLEACRPNVVLVEKSAPRDVLEALLQKGVTLVVDMKLHRLERIARCTRSPILPADKMLSEELKQCDSMYFEKLVEEHAQLGEGGKKPRKTLMFLEGSPTHLGCTILLKGSHIEELKRIKCAVQCAVVMAYHFILETYFLLDQEVMLSTIVSDGGASKRVKESFDINSNGSHNEEALFEAALEERTSLPLSNGFHEEHAVESAEQNSSAGTDCLSFYGQKDVSLESAAANRISDNVHQESFQEDGSPFIDAPSQGRDILTGLHEDGPKNLTSQSEYEDVIQNVMGTLVSPADQYMQPLLHLGERDADAQAMKSVSVLPSTEARVRCGTEPNGHSNDEKLFDADSISDSRKTGSDSDDCNGRKDNIRAVLDSESMLVLMSRRNASRGTICKQSHFSYIKFYRNFDFPLGMFLRDNVLNQTVLCKECHELPEAHYYYYAHHNKQLTIRVKQIEGEPLHGESEGKLWMWSRCGICKPEKEGNKNTTKRVLISNAARGFSFGKFLELSFSNHSSLNRLSNCGHSLHRDFLYFFGLGSMVAMFRYSPVVRYSVSVPPQKRELGSPVKGEWLQEETGNVYSRGMLLFAEVSGYLKKIETGLSGLTMNINGSIKDFPDIEKMLGVEKFEFEENIKNTCIKNGHSVHKLLCLNRLRWELFVLACIWNRRLQLLVSSRSPSPDNTTISKAVQEKPNVSQDTNKESEAKSTAAIVGTSQLVSDVNGDETSDSRSDVEVHINNVPGSAEVSAKENAVPLSSIIDDNRSRASVDNSILSSPQDAKDSAEQLMVLSSNRSSCKENTPMVGHISTEIKSTVLEELGESTSNADGSSSDKAATEPVSNFENSRGQWAWNPFSEIKEECMRVLNNKVQLPSPLDSLRFDPLHSADCLPTISQMISEEGSRMHFPLCIDDYILSDYEGEISSIIACALAFMKDIPQKAEQFIKDDNHAQPEKGTLTSTDESVSLIRAISEPNPLFSLSSASSEPDVIHSVSSMSFDKSRFSSFYGPYHSASIASLDSSHPEVRLGPEAHLGKPKYSVVCLYANEFHGLRNLCYPSELDYIASLSRCKIWDAKGGKSKSFFAKTLDDRLIIKEVKKAEFDSFMTFADEYFRHINQSFKSGNQTCLAKILGIYQVTMKQPKGGKETKHDVMVMENLSFGRKISRQYDLKGALHARFTANADGSGDVLLDQNFVNDMNLSPLYVGQKAKRLLQRAVWNDTTFLNTINVMDYSLLVGVDVERRELVCGIIDYLREYTWDKQLETWVKSSLVVPKHLLPTIISPGEYKKRFRKFMDTHFLTVPDLWCSRRSSNPCKLCGIHHTSQPKPEKQEEVLIVHNIV